MIKKLKKFQIKLTPFNATKDWELSTSNNQDLLLMDDTSSSLDEPVALEYIDYGSINQSQPIINSECDIALEQQPDDLAIVEKGLNVSGFFYPELDPVNTDGTFKRVIWHQVHTMFYNQYKDPTKIWGATNIDFDLSQTKRKISDEFKIFNIPTDIFGDTIVPLSITFEDTSLDDNFVIADDGNANLFAGMNLFSKKDVIGHHPNIFIAGNNDTCNQYLGVVPIPILSISHPNFVNWPATTWSLIQVVPGGGTNGSATGNFNGASLNVSGRGNGSPSAKVEAMGELTYSGSTANCQAALAVTASSGEIMGFFVLQDGVSKLTANISSTAPGTYNLPFTINSTTMSHLQIVGLADISDPARLFIYESSNILNAFSLVITDTAVTNSLSWNVIPSSSIIGFGLERSVGNINNFTTLAFLPSTSFSYNDFPVSINTAYYYRISAFTLQSTSSFSNIVGGIIS